MTGTVPHANAASPRSSAGILTQLALYSINLRIMDSKANQAVGVDKYPLMVSQRYVRELTPEKSASDPASFSRLP